MVKGFGFQFSYQRNLSLKLCKYFRFFKSNCNASKNLSSHFLKQLKSPQKTSSFFIGSPLWGPWNKWGKYYENLKDAFRMFLKALQTCAKNFKPSSFFPPEFLYEDVRTKGRPQEGRCDTFWGAKYLSEKTLDPGLWIHLFLLSESLYEGLVKNGVNVTKTCKKQLKCFKNLQIRAKKNSESTFFPTHKINVNLGRMGNTRWDTY